MSATSGGLATIAVELARAQLGAGRPLATVAAGQSMWPLVRDGQRVTILPLDRPPRVGDVVLLELGRRLVLHRVVRQEGDAVVTKGDAVAWADPPVTAASLLGVLAPRAWDRWVALASRSGGAPLARVTGIARRAVVRWRTRRRAR